MTLYEPRAPARAQWDGYFFIVIFPNGEWCKVHLFSGGRQHCMSALEGLDGPAQELALVGTSRGVERRGGPIEAITFDEVTARGDAVAFTFTEDARVRASGIDASLHATDPFFWIKVPRVLTYFTATGKARVTIDGVTRDGLGLLEHAWGGTTRVDVARFAPRRWQWDVLSLGESRFFAGLAFGSLGLGVNRLRIRVHDWNTQGQTRVPACWSGTMTTHDGALRYEARASTPASPELPGGGFLGFTWDGSLGSRNVSGAGFCEYRAA